MTLTHEQFIRSFGPANCWTGSVGEACCRIKELLEENARLKSQIEWLDNQYERLRRKDDE